MLFELRTGRDKQIADLAPQPQGHTHEVRRCEVSQHRGQFDERDTHRCGEINVALQGAKGHGRRYRSSKRKYSTNQVSRAFAIPLLITQK